MLTESHSAPHSQGRSVLGGTPVNSRIHLARRSSTVPQDALQAYDAGLAGVVLSNHGGRQLDFSRSGVEVLTEVTRELGKQRGLKFPNEKFQLFVDGGVRRANDVLKAVALGATAGKRSAALCRSQGG